MDKLLIKKEKVNFSHLIYKKKEYKVIIIISNALRLFPRQTSWRGIKKSWFA